MKNNQPVTGREKRFSPRDNLLSTTDLKGVISYVNDDFCKIAEFEREQLVDRNHNVIRHPDMPEAAFANLWKFLKAGTPWKGIVKNRCAGGDHYWVDAYVMPIKDQQGHPYQYQSVRFIPEAAEVARAEAVYRDLNQKKPPRALRGPVLPVALKLTLLGAIGLLPLLGAAAWQAPQAAGALALGTLGSLALTAALLHLGLGRLRSLKEKARAIFDNELMQYIYTGQRDELGQIELALKMKESELRSILGRVKDSSEQIQGACASSESLMQNATQGAQRQQSEIHQLVAAVEEMSASIQEVARNCEASSEHAARARALTEESRSISRDTIASNNSLVGEIDGATTIVQQLAQSSQEIGSVLDVIKSVAEQTNLLALNAAIEAARAGEQGRGFAVVADEVRTLAQRTQASTEEIEQMIAKIQQGTRQAVTAMEQSKQASNHSVEQLNLFSGALARIDEAVEGIANMSTQIATASEQQSCVASEVSENITTISSQADDTVRLAQEAHALTRALGRQAERQLGLVDQFVR